MILLLAAAVFIIKHNKSRQLVDMSASSHWSQDPQPITTTPSGRIKRREDCLYVNDDDYYSVA